jgi:hypothetical protein
MFKRGRQSVSGMSLIVDFDDSAVVWRGSVRVPIDGGYMDSTPYLVRFGNARNLWSHPQRLAERLLREPVYEISGEVDRTTGMARIVEGVSQEHLPGKASDRPPPEDLEYNLRCKPAKRLF